MPIPQAITFRNSTAPRSVFVGYGGNMAKVLAALEAYWESHNNGQEVAERLLYALWKECCHWLKKKEGKPQNKQGELFQRRKLNVELLRDAAMEELANISPRVAQALNLYQENKLQQGPVGVGLKGLSPGYQFERDHYVQTGKTSGSSISGSNIHATLQSQGANRRLRFVSGKRPGDLTVSDAMKISQLFPSEPVQYKNKVERLRFLVSVSEDALLCDLDENPVLMVIQRFGKYMAYPYAMDKYGNLFVESHAGLKSYVGQNEGTGQYELKEGATLNHSSFLAGSDVLCAGCIHIGYNCGTRGQEAGVLSAIDNRSGHYKPTPENLLNCLNVLREQGVAIDTTRVEARTAQGDLVYWGRDFVRGVNPWRSLEQPSPGFLKAPPIL